MHLVSILKFTSTFFEFRKEIHFIFEFTFHVSLTFKINFFYAFIHYVLSNDVSNSLDFQSRYFIISFLLRNPTILLPEEIWHMCIFVMKTGSLLPDAHAY